MGQSTIIILGSEDRQQVGGQLKAILDRERNYQVNLIGEGASELRNFSKTPPQLVIAVLPIARNEAHTRLAELRSVLDQIPLLPVISPDALSDGFDRILRGEDFLVTPLREAEVCVRVRRLAQGEERQIPLEVAAESCGLAQLIGKDPAFVALKRRIPLVAQFESTVLLTGETGTGKERFARALHYSSPRSGKPFLPVNCGAIPVDLFESELFGHRKGAFTGAVATQPGLIAEAKDGTLFLDEIETLSLAGQVKLLRFLQDQMYNSVGSSKLTHANVWIIASTNVQLPTKIREGSFREDLFYRLAVIGLALPALRQRSQDIPLLAEHFWNLYAARAGRPQQQLSPRVMDALCQYPWPGNVRELENVIQQLAVLTESEIVEPEDLSIPHLRAVDPTDNSFAQRKAVAIEEFERSYVTSLLRAHQGNVTHAAHEARKDRRAFGRLVKKYQLAKR